MKRVYIFLLICLFNLCLFSLCIFIIYKYKKKVKPSSSKIPTILTTSTTPSTTSSLKTTPSTTSSLKPTPSTISSLKTTQELIIIKENIYLIDDNTNKYCGVDNENYLICNIVNKSDAPLFTVSNVDHNKYKLKINDKIVKIKNHNYSDLSLYKKNIPNQIYISSYIGVYNQIKHDYNMYCYVNNDNYVYCNNKKKDIKSFRIETENDNLFNQLEYLPDYLFKGCYNDYPNTNLINDSKEFSKFIMRGNILECDTFAKNNNYKLYALSNYNYDDNKVDCMVSNNNPNLDEYGKFGLSSNYNKIGNILYGHDNSNCIFGVPETNEIKSNNILCYDKNDKIIIVPKNERFEKCKISCIKKNNNIYERDAFRFISTESIHQGNIKYNINNKILDNNNFITGIYDDIKSECKRFINPYNYIKCYENNDKTKDLVEINRNNILDFIYRCLETTMKCKDKNNNESIIKPDEFKNMVKDNTIDNKCKYIYNNNTNKYINLNDMFELDNKNDILKPVSSKLTIIDKNNNIQEVDLQNNETIGNSIICKNPFNKKMTLTNPYSLRDLIGHIDSNNKLFDNNNTCNF
jgi:hypothetical protein